MGEERIPLTDNPYNVELLDLWNEIGGKLVIKYHRAVVTPAKSDLQDLRAVGLPTDVETCVLASLAGHGWSEEKVLSFMKEASEASAIPSVTFEAAEDEALNITNKENNPILDKLIEGIETQQKKAQYENQ